MIYSLGLQYHLIDKKYHYDLCSPYTDESGYLAKNLEGRFIHLDARIKEIIKTDKNLRFKIKGASSSAFRREAAEDELKQFKKNLETKFSAIVFEIKN